MTRLRNSPRLHKGAIVAIDPLAPIPTLIAFQYNPESVTRTLTPNMSDGEGSAAEVQRVDRPPTETISLEAKFDATDDLEVRSPVAVDKGIYPQLSALEMLLYPPSSRYIINAALSLIGTLEIVPPIAPLILFVWGHRRVVPVRITKLGIEETAYDERLNPIHATVSLDMSVLSYAEFQYADPGSWIYLAHQVVKEGMADTGTARSVRGLSSRSIRSFF